jgi:hypothetical protein
VAGVPPVADGAALRSTGLRSTAFGGAALSRAPLSRAAFVGADRGADTAVLAAADPAGLVALYVARIRAAEALGVPPRGVIAQVVVDICGVAPKAPVGRRAAVPRRACVAKPNVKVISFAAHASSLLVARRSPVIGVRPLPEGRAPGVR